MDVSLIDPSRPHSMVGAVSCCFIMVWKNCTSMEGIVHAVIHLYLACFERELHVVVRHDMTLQFTATGGNINGIIACLARIRFIIEKCFYGSASSERG
ncbi:hypothetical protein D918_09532 [Trichuris suis]|nr:hypothetical protein D918_09532 [Trichuris suis]